MVTLVVTINILISLMLLFVAWRVWQLKKRIALLSDSLLHYERCSHNLLYKAPENIYLGQQNILNLRQSNQSLQIQIQQVRQIVSLLLLGRRNWGRYIRRSSSISEKQQSVKSVET